MADDTEVLIRFCEDEWNQGRQSENQRATITNYITFLFGVIFGFIIEIGFKKKALPLAILLIFIGMFGTFVCAKYYERWRFHRKRVAYLRERLDELHPNANLIKIMKEASLEHNKEFPISQKIRLQWFWCILNLFIALVGIICTTIIIIFKS